MKRKIFCGAAMLAVLALVGCKKEQSQFTLDNIEQKATISGTVVYQSNLVGQASEEVALSGVRVAAKVDYSQYSDDAKGVKQFEVETDSAGQFSISIPTGSKSIKATLHIDVVKTAQDGKTIYLGEYDRNYTVNANEAKVEKIVLAKDEVLSECVAEGTLKGKLTYDAGTVNKADGTKEEGNVAAVGANVVANVEYAAAGVTRKFISKTDANGEYVFTIPVEENGCAVEVNIEQFKGTYTEFKNNQWVTVDAYYSMKASQSAAVKGGEISVLDIEADKCEKIYEATKTQVAFKVKGKLLQEIEKAQYDSKGDKRIGTELGTKVSAYAFTVDVRNYSTGERIIYAGNKANEKGEYEVEVKLYDDWDVANDVIEVTIYADQSNVVNDFAHYYFAWDEDSDKFLFDPDTDYKTQRLTGIYKGGKDNVVSNMYIDEKQIFFDLNMDDAVLQFEPENEDLIFGVREIGSSLTYASASMIKPDGAAGFAGYYSEINFGKKDGADRLIYAGGITIW